MNRPVKPVSWGHSGFPDKENLSLVKESKYEYKVQSKGFFCFFILGLYFQAWHKGLSWQISAHFSQVLTLFIFSIKLPDFIPIFFMGQGSGSGVVVVVVDVVDVSSAVVSVVISVKSVVCVDPIVDTSEFSVVDGLSVP